MFASFTAAVVRACVSFGFLCGRRTRAFCSRPPATAPLLQCLTYRNPTGTQLPRLPFSRKNRCFSQRSRSRVLGIILLFSHGHRPRDARRDRERPAGERGRAPRWLTGLRSGAKFRLWISSRIAGFWFRSRRAPDFVREIRFENRFFSVSAAWIARKEELGVRVTFESFKSIRTLRIYFRDFRFLPNCFRHSRYKLRCISKSPE